MVAMLRNGSRTAGKWGPKAAAARAIVDSGNSGHLAGVVEAIRDRSQHQPEIRRPVAGKVEELLKSGLDRWRLIAKRHPELIYVEYGKAVKPVVLGDPLHRKEGLPVVFDNAPQSLRDIEETLGIEY